jgi:cytochrome c2
MPIAAFALANVASVGISRAQEFRGDPIQGRHIFVERECNQCHSIWGNGGTLGPDFATVGAGRSLLQLAGMFWNHTPRMIETVRRRGVQWPIFSEGELADIISYIYYVKLFDESGDADLGERWFRDKRCAECHAVGETGGDVGPALDEFAEYIAPIVLAADMWNHGVDMRLEQAARGISTPSFAGRELADIQAYLRRQSTLRHRDVVMLEPPDPNRGEDLFGTKGCIECHGGNGGGTVYGPDIQTATERLSVSEIAGELWNHSSVMADSMQIREITYPRFEPGEMADVIAFLYYLRFYEEDGDLQEGELVFSRKGCATCHASAGRAAIGPNLSGSAAVRTPLSLATAMWNHAPAMYDRIQREQVDWPRFEAEEMRDLSVYLKSLVSPGGGL